MEVLAVKDLFKDFGKIRAVDGISFSVTTGEIFGLIGPNGAGKTTTLRIISTLLKPTSGAVSVFGFDTAKEGNKIREAISYLPEEAGAYKNLPGISYLQFMAEFYVADRAAKRNMVDDAIAIAGLGDRIKDKVQTYSKGMVRKLLVARALMHKPKLAVLDEPTSGLDVMNSMEVRKIIKNYSQQGVTVLLSSHNMLEIEFLSTRVSILDKGKILETGSPADLKSRYGAANLEQVFIQIMK
jgi:ABC-2 type transport system ATP-binding protein